MHQYFSLYNLFFLSDNTDFDKKNISDGYKNILVGKWWVIRYEDGTLILQKNIGDKNDSCELCLTPKYSMKQISHFLFCLYF